jgi:hypothetical protein
MVDPHEEQLLSDLLRSIARDDACLDAPHLESRVIAAADARTKEPSLGASVRLKPDTAYYLPDTTHYIKAAALVMAVLVPGLVWIAHDMPTYKSEVKVEPTPAAVAETTVAIAPTPSPTHPARPTLPTIRSTRRIPTSPTRPVLPMPPSLSPDEFVPLLPISAQELTGSLQIVRVQMPNASLGPLRSPRQHPGELVEADVLLGEDGMARAIRLSTSGSLSPWRPR